MYRYSRHIEVQSNGDAHFTAGHFLWQYKSPAGQNVPQIESCVGQNRILTFSAGQMSDVRLSGAFSKLGSLIEFFNNSDAILNFGHIAMHCGLSRVIQLF